MMNQTDRDKKRKNSTTLRKFIISKLNPIRKKQTNKNNIYSGDDFIKKYSQTGTTKTTDINQLDIRRKVFVSLLGIYQSWRQCPSYILYSAIFILPLKQDWIYNPSKYTEQLKTHIIAKIRLFSDVSEMNEFIELLKWKHSQGLVFWMLDESKCIINDNSNNLIHPFWCNLSKKLSNLYDPVTGNKYKAINFDLKWWQNKDKYVSKYNVKIPSVVSELCFLTMGFKNMQEILYQSNPDSLDPVKSYQKNDFPDYNWYKYNENDEELVLAVDNEGGNEGDDEDVLWISEEYDPYDLN